MTEIRRCQRRHNYSQDVVVDLGKEGLVKHVADKLLTNADLVKKLA